MENMKTIWNTIIDGYRRLERSFTGEEAWMLFRVVAILETVGWTLLITGILFKQFDLPLHDWILPIGGTLHGVFVMFYMLIVFFVHRSLRWSFRRMVFAEVISIIPYAALVFERWVSYERQQRYYTLAAVGVIAAAADSSGREGFQSQ